MGVVEYNKLVRDRIPEIIKDSGKQCVVRTLDDNEYLSKLNVKLGEELKEYLESGDLDEIADILEVAYAIAEVKGYTRDDLEAIRLNKVSKNGGFKEKILLEHVVEDMNGLINKLVNYVKTLKDFTIVDSMDGNYNHIGATLTDAILQAGIKYDTVVKPRVLKIQSIQSANTTSGFISLLLEHSPEIILDFRGEKPNRLLHIAKFFKEQDVETEYDLRQWLENDVNVVLLGQQKGFGSKTIDYLKILVGIQTSAVDRHLFKFLNQTGIELSSYEEVQSIINATADILNVNRALFDHSIWIYMSSRQ